MIDLLVKKKNNALTSSRKCFISFNSISIFCTYFTSSSSTVLNRLDFIQIVKKLYLHLIWEWEWQLSSDSSASMLAATPGV